MKKVMATLGLMLIVLLCGSCTSGETKTSGMFYYEITETGMAQITGYNWSEHEEGEDISIPGMLDGYTVTEIGQKAFAYITYDSCGKIEKRYRTEKVGSLTIPDTIRTIGDKAFMNMNMEAFSITIPASVEHIGSGAFAHIKGLQQFVVAAGNPTYAAIDGILYNKQEKELVAFPYSYDGKQIPYGKNHERVLTIPEGIVKIGDYAFFGSTQDLDQGGSTVISLPESLKAIGDYAFARSNWFSENYQFSFPDALETMGEGAFYGWYKTSGSVAGRFCLEDTKITQIPAWAFAVSKTVEICFPDNLECIGRYAFAGVDTFDWPGREIEIPVNVKTIEDRAFFLSNCVPVFKEGSLLVSIGYEAFGDCGNIKTLDLPQGLTSISDRAFADCKNLTAISIPASVKKIGKDICDKNKVRIDVEANSYAALWASENGYITQQAGQEDTSWLN